MQRLPTTGHRFLYTNSFRYVSTRVVQQHQPQSRSMDQIFTWFAHLGPGPSASLQSTIQHSKIGRARIIGCHMSQRLCRNTNRIA